MSVETQQCHNSSAAAQNSNQLQHDYLQLKSDYEKLKANYDDLKDRYHEQRLDNKELRGDFKDLRKDYKQLRKDLKNSTKDQKYLRRAFKYLNRDHELVQHKYADLTTQNDGLKKKLPQLFFILRKAQLVRVMSKLSQRISMNFQCIQIGTLKALKIKWNTPKQLNLLKI